MVSRDVGPVFRAPGRYLVIPRVLDAVDRLIGVLARWTVRSECDPDRRGVLKMVPHPEIGLPDRFVCGCGGMTSARECVHIAAVRAVECPEPPSPSARPALQRMAA